MRKAAGQLPAAEPSETWESPVFRSAAQRANLALFADHVNAENNPVTFYRRLPLLKPEPYQWDGRQLKLAGNITIGELRGLVTRMSQEPGIHRYGAPETHPLQWLEESGNSPRPEEAGRLCVLGLQRELLERGLARLDLSLRQQNDFHFINTLIQNLHHKGQNHLIPLEEVAQGEIEILEKLIARWPYNSRGAPDLNANFNRIARELTTDCKGDFILLGVLLNDLGFKGYSADVHDTSVHDNAQDEPSRHVALMVELSDGRYYMADPGIREISGVIARLEPGSIHPGRASMNFELLTPEEREKRPPHLLLHRFQVSELLPGIQHVLLGDLADSTSSPSTRRQFAEFLDIALALNPMSVYALTKKGFFVTDPRNAEQRVAFLHKAIEIDSFYLNTWRYLGMEYLRLQNREGAYEAYRQMAVIAPWSVWAWSQWGVALYKMQKFEEAERAARTAMKYAPFYKPAWNLLGAAQFRKRELSRALGAYQIETAIDAKDASGWNNMGTTYKDLHDDALAVASCVHALRLSPTYRLAWENLRLIFSRQKRWGLALLCRFGAWVSTHPNGVLRSSWALRGLAWFVRRLPSDPNSHRQIVQSLNEVVSRISAQHHWRGQAITSLVEEFGLPAESREILQSWMIGADSEPEARKRLSALLPRYTERSLTVLLDLAAIWAEEPWIRFNVAIDRYRISQRKTGLNDLLTLYVDAIRQNSKSLAWIALLGELATADLWGHKLIRKPVPDVLTLMISHLYDSDRAWDAFTGIHSHLSPSLREAIGKFVSAEMPHTRSQFEAIWASLQRMALEFDSSLPDLPTDLEGHTNSLLNEIMASVAASPVDASDRGRTPASEPPPGSEPSEAAKRSA